MKQYNADKILNIALAGHSGSGKTSLAEAIIYLSGGSDRLGKILEGNTVLDFDSEEIRRKVSVLTAVAPVEWNGTKINLIDTPGLFDFEGGVHEGIRAADTALIVVSGKNGINVGTEKAVASASKAELIKMFFVNGLCDEGAQFYQIFSNLKDTFGSSVCPVIVPFVEGGQASIYINMLENKAYKYSKGKAAETEMPDMGGRLDELRTAINEAVAETSEDLLDKFIMGEEFTQDEIINGISQGVKDGTVCPVFCGDALNTFAIDMFLNALTQLTPSAASKGAEQGTNESGDPVEIAIDEEGPAVAVVFKTVADPFVGKLSYLKVISGKVSSEAPLINMRTGNSERIAKVLAVKGKKQEEAKFIAAGDIGAVPKLSDAVTGDTLCAAHKKVILERVVYPKPNYSLAIYPKGKGDEEKVSQGVSRLKEEDPTIKFETNIETHEMILSGMGEQHLDVITSKLKSKFNVDVILQKPKVAYRETIRKPIEVQGRHKKQSGGHGQFGDVWIKFEPCDAEGLEFTETVVGGAVPKGFFPAVEKGLKDAIKKGPLAGYPVVGLKATLYDGSYHPVDSSEMSFKLAAAIAYKNGMPKASPVLLEPIGTLKAIVPDSNMGDVMGEVNKRRGRILGMNPDESGAQIVEAEVPMAEMHDFSIFIRQITQGRGRFSFVFERYEEAPANVSQKVIEQRKAETQES